MAYSELIKDISRIREYLREFFVFGFRSRMEIGRKSPRTGFRHLGQSEIATKPHGGSFFLSKFRKNMLYVVVWCGIMTVTGCFARVRKGESYDLREQYSRLAITLHYRSVNHIPERK